MLIRMISSIGRWDGSQIIERDDALFTGDAISDLRTSNNTLSVWLISDKSELNDILIALALSRNKIDKLSYVEIEEAFIDDLKIELDESELGVAPGVKRDSNILEKHRNLTEIDYWRLGLIAEYLFTQVKSNHKETFTKKKIKDLINKYVDDGKIEISEMNESVRESLGR